MLVKLKRGRERVCKQPSPTSDRTKGARASQTPPLGRVQDYLCNDIPIAID